MLRIIQAFLLVFPCLWVPLFRDPAVAPRQGLLCLTLAVMAVVLAWRLRWSPTIAYTADDRRSIFEAISLSAIVPCIYACLQAWGVDHHLLVGRYASLLPAWFPHRAFSTFGNPNVFGSWLVVVIPAAAWCVVEAHKSSRHGWALVHQLALALAVVALCAAQARSAALALIVGILVVLGRCKAFWPVAFLGGCLGAGMAAAIWESDLLSLVSMEDRLRLYHHALSSILAHPLAGVGPATDSTFAHNVHLSVAAANGIPYYLAWLAIFLFAVGKSRYDEPGWMIFLLLIFVDGQFSVGMEFVGVKVYYWLLVFMAVLPEGRVECERLRWWSWLYDPLLVVIAGTLIARGMELLYFDHLRFLGWR